MENFPNKNGYFCLEDRISYDRKRKGEKRCGNGQKRHFIVRTKPTVHLKNESDAKDALQDIFLKIWEKKPVFQNEMHCRAWLIQTTKHHCLDLLKSSWFKKRVAYEPDDRGEKEKTQEDRLLEKIQMLPAKDREVLYLYYYEEYSIKEISQIIRRKESTIQSRLAAARRRLKGILDRGEGAER